MSKKNKAISKEPEIILPPPASENLFHNLKNQIVIVILLALVFYGNTFFNDYALDDIVSITGNKFTQKGFKGISTLFFKDSFYGYFGSSAGLSGGRWRPLALITFAIEQQFFGQNAHISHFINVLILILTGIILLLFLRKFVFPQQEILSLLTVVLFIIHPIHTEVVANIKSRDELLSFLFLILTLHFALSYLNHGKKKLHLLSACVFYFTALLSKENGLTFIAIIPLSFYFFSPARTNAAPVPNGTFGREFVHSGRSESIKKCLLNSLPYVAIAIIYVCMRVSIIGFNYHEVHDVNISPLSNASTIQWWATIFLALGKYISLLFFPHPLSADYSYNQIPYVDFSNLMVWFSIIIQTALFIYALTQLKKKNLVAYGILFYFLSIFIVSNIIVDVGAILGERFLYQASLGFCICLALIFNFIYKKFGRMKKYAAPAFLGMIILVCAIKTISRNSNWKNDQTLFIQDVQTCPNSVRTNIAAGSAFIINAQKETDSLKKAEMLNRSITYLEKALVISPGSADPILNLGVAYFNLGNYDMAEKMWNEAEGKGRGAEIQQYKRSLSINLMNKGLQIGNKKDYGKSIIYFYKAIRSDSSNYEAWYNLGGAYYTIARYDSAIVAWERVLKLKPDYENAMKGLEAAKNMLIKK